VAPNPSWTVSDDAMLSELVGRGLSIDLIARQLHRSISAVRNRAKRLHVRIAKRLDTATPVRAFQIGQRVRLSALGAERCPRMKRNFGRVSAKGSGHSYY